MPDKRLLRRIMVVDDEEYIRETIVELFSIEGIEVLPASGLQECLSYLRDGFRGVILMDGMMPEMNGWDVIREIERNGMLKGNIFSMLTAMDAPDERLEGLQEVLVDYITKPFDPKELISTVKKYFEYLDHPAEGSV